MTDTKTRLREFWIVDVKSFDPLAFRSYEDAKAFGWHDNKIIHVREVRDEDQ